MPEYVSKKVWNEQIKMNRYFQMTTEIYILLLGLIPLHVIKTAIRESLQNLSRQISIMGQLIINYYGFENPQAENKIIMEKTLPAQINGKKSDEIQPTQNRFEWKGLTNFSLTASFITREIVQVPSENAKSFPHHQKKKPAPFERGVVLPGRWFLNFLPGDLWRTDISATLINSQKPSIIVRLKNERFGWNRSRH